MKKQKILLSLLLVTALLMGLFAPAMGVSATETNLTKVEKWNLVLCDEIKANFYLSVSDSVSDDAVVNVTDGYGTTAYALSQMEKDSNGLYVFTASLAAAQLADEITLQLRDGETLGDVHTYTAVKYAQAILNGNYSAQTKALVKQMLNYGAAAQLYFDYNTKNLANAGYENTETPAIPEASAESVVSGQVEGISYYGAALLFESQIGIRFYFDVTGNIGDYTFSTADGEKDVYIGKDGRYCVDVLNINPQDYDTAVALSVSNGTDTMTVSYSPMRYISRKYHGSDNTALVDLVGAMYTYHTAAKAYLEAGGVAYRGIAFTAGTNTNISFAAGDYDYISFDYKLTTEGSMSVIIRSPGDIPYYGSFSFKAAGEQGDYVGVTCEPLEDGYIHVEIDLDAVNITNSAWNRDNVPETISKLNIYGAWTSANGYIDNIQVSYAEGNEPVIRGEATTAGTTKRFSFALADYDYVSFEYRLATAGKICVRLPSSGDVPYYGIYDFTADGGNYDGITCEKLDDDYIKVTMKLSELTKTNNANNRDNVPEAVKAVDIYAWSTANAYIDNVQAYNEEVIRGETTTAGATTRFSFALENYESVSFEYKLITDGKITVRVPSSGDVPYFGLYDFTANGAAYDGITCEKLDDGYIKVTMTLDELTRTNNANNRDNVPTAIKGIDIYAWSTADAYIDNISTVSRPVERGDALTAGADWTNTAEAAAYQEITVDYWITNDGQFAVQLLDAEGANYYGNYYFDADGEIQDYAGVSCMKRSDRYMKITFKVAELAVNSGTAPAEIADVKIIGSESTATGFVDNVQYKLTAVPTGIRVGVLSDVHINANDTEQTTRFEHALTALKLRGVDAVLISGDLQEHTGGVGAVDAIESYAASWFKVFPNNTNDLTGEHVEPIFIYGNHDKTLVADGYWPESLGLYEDAFIKEINGYYFVGAQYSKESAATWLIEHAKEDSNGYPFFYTQHCTMYDTSYGIKDVNTGTSQTVMNNLKDASNAIAFTGHYHIPATDERSIWQSTDEADPDFTSVLVPSINYAHLESMGLGKTTYPLSQQGLYMVVEGSDVSITRLSFADPADEDGLVIGADWSFDAADPTDRPYDYDTRAAAVSKPAFASDAAISVDFLSQERVTFSFPAATVTAPEGFSDLIEHYYVELINTATGEVVNSYVMPTGFIYDNQAARFAGPYSVGFVGLSADTEYQIKVYARECYQVSSDPLCVTIHTADGVAENVRGTATTAGATTTLSFTAGDYDFVSFEYRPTTEGDISVILRSPGDIPYYGAFRFNAAGETEDYAGITTEIMDDGYILVTMKLSELGITNGKYNRDNAPETVSKLAIYQWSTADAYVDNVQAYDEVVIRGTQTTAKTTKRFSFTLADYDYVSFEYRLITDGKICVRLPSSGDVPYYGIYDFTAAGGTYAGVTCETLDDGYIRVTFKLDELTKTNNANNRDNVPASIKAVDIYAWSTADAYIDNVQAYNAE